MLLRLTKRALPLASVLVAACGSSGPSETEAPGVSVEDFAAAFARAYCDGVAPCCGGVSPAFNRNTCVARMTADWGQIVARPPARRKFDRVKAGRCVEKARSYGSTCRTSAAHDAELSEVCQAIYTGTVASGGACQSHFDCADVQEGPMRCKVDATSTAPPAPICLLDLPGQMGEPCLGAAPYDTPYPHVMCAEGLYCDSANRCASRLGAGESCAPRAQCQAALWCQSTSPTDATCQPRVELGRPCRVDGECLGNVCHEELCSDGRPLDAVRCNGGS